MYLHTYHKVSTIYKPLYFTGNPGIIYYMRNPGKTLGSRQKVLEEKLPHLKQVGKHDSQIVSTEKEIIEFSKLGVLLCLTFTKLIFQGLNPAFYQFTF